MAVLFQHPVSRPWTEFRIEALRASFSVDSDSQCSPGLLVDPRATTKVSLAQGKELRLCGQQLWLEVQSYYLLAVVKAVSLYKLFAGSTRNFKQEIHFFLGCVPMDR